MQTCHYTGAPFSVSRSFATIPLLASCISVSSTCLLGLILICEVKEDPSTNFGAESVSWRARWSILEERFFCIFINVKHPVLNWLRYCLNQYNITFCLLLSWGMQTIWNFFTLVGIHNTSAFKYQFALHFLSPFPCLNLFWKEMRCYKKYSNKIYLFVLWFLFLSLVTIFVKFSLILSVFETVAFSPQVFTHAWQCFSSCSGSL